MWRNTRNPRPTTLSRYWRTTYRFQNLKLLTMRKVVALGLEITTRWRCRDFLESLFNALGTAGNFVSYRYEPRWLLQKQLLREVGSHRPDYNTLSYHGKVKTNVASNEKMLKVSVPNQRALDEFTGDTRTKKTNRVQRHATERQLSQSLIFTLYN